MKVPTITVTIKHSIGTSLILVYIVKGKGRTRKLTNNTNNIIIVVIKTRVVN